MLRIILTLKDKYLNWVEYFQISRPVEARLKDTVCMARWMLIAMSIVILFFRAPIFLVELKIKWLPMFRIVNEPWATEVF